MNYQFEIISVLSVLAGYIVGSVNFAIPITKLVTGKDIRTMGNHNPGTSNVLRCVGPFWGVLVGFLDGCKGLVPVLLLRLLYFKADAGIDFFILYLAGFAAVLGHCKSVFMKFRGGGGVGTMLGVSLFFVPVEFLLSMLIGGAIVLIFFKIPSTSSVRKPPSSL